MVETRRPSDTSEIKSIKIGTVAPMFQPAGDIVGFKNSHSTGDRNGDSTSNN